MARICFDRFRGLDTNAGTEALPKQNLDLYTGSASDELSIRRGDDQIVLTAEKTVVSGVPGAPTRYTVYGEAQVPYATIRKPPGSAGTTVLNASFRHNYEFSDIRFDLTGTSYRALYVSATAAGHAYGIRIRRCGAFGSVGDIPGFYFGIENTSNSIYDVVVEDTDAWDNGADGFTILAGSGVTLRRCRGWRNGRSGPNGGHNFRLTTRKTTVSSGWTQNDGETGNVWSRALAAHELDVAFVQHPSYARMTKYTGLNPHTSTPLGGFAVGSGRLWANAGAALNGVSMTYVWNAGRGNRLEFCESWESLWNTAAPFQEGHAASFDDWASDSVMLGCVFRDSQGLGVSNNGGDNNAIIGCVIYGNEMRAISLGSGVNTKVLHNTMWGNNSGRGASSAEIAGVASSTGAEVVNNIIRTRDGLGYGVYFDVASGCVATSNAIYGPSDPVFGGTETGTVSIDPDDWLEEDGSLVYDVANPLANAGTYLRGATLRNGRALPGQVPIGAHRMTHPRAMRG